MRFREADHPVRPEVARRVGGGGVKEQIDSVDGRAERLGAIETSLDDLDVESAQCRGGFGLA